MAPPVQIPADFGRKHIGAPTHGNLTLTARDGEIVLANSIILALNSPVIDRLTGEFFQQEIGVEEFHRDTVDCFVEACYTGEADRLTKDNFREFNKMSNAFEVAWLVDGCIVFFVGIVEGLTELSPHEDVLYTVEEATYVLKALKKGYFLSVIAEKLRSMKTRRSRFLKEYMTDFSLFTEIKLKGILGILEDDTSILMTILTDYIKENPQCINDNTRFLLERADLGGCSASLLSSMFSVLQKVTVLTSEDYKLLLAISDRKHTAELESGKGSEETDGEGEVHSYLHCFEDYLKMNTFEEVLKSLGESAVVTSLYICFDGLWTWLYQNRGVAVNFDDGTILQTILDIKLARQWKKIAYSYVESFAKFDFKTKTHPNLLRTLFLTCEELVSQDTEVAYSSKFPRDVFLEKLLHGRFVFKRTDERSKICKRQSGDCGLVLKCAVTHTGDFSMQLTDNTRDYPPTIHPHPNLISPTDIHIGLVRGGEFLRPLSWMHTLTSNEEGEEWEWGCMRFHDGERRHLVKRGGSGKWKEGWFYTAKHDLQLRIFYDPPA